MKKLNTREIVGFALNFDDKSSNALMPSEKQVNKLQFLIDMNQLELSTLEPKEWLNRIDSISDTLFPNWIKNFETKKLDQQQRAKVIVSNLGNKKNIILLDGHGRFFYLLLKEI